MTIIITGDKGEYDREVGIDTVGGAPWRWTAITITDNLPKINPPKWVAKHGKSSWCRSETIWFFLDKEDADDFKERWIK